MTVNFDVLSGLLPSELLEAVRCDSDTILSAISTANNFVSWFASSGIPFFRSYTDHSDKHSLEVLSSAIGFISEEAYGAITSEDISILLSACYCHDAGMHLTENQFLALIDHDHQTLYNKIDVKSWPTLWLDFLQEAKRFNQEKLIELFGDTNPIPETPSNTLDFTERNRLLIGEFLRRNHPRLAHDIALGLNLRIGIHRLVENFSDDERDIIGFIARSHGEPLRSTFKYIEDNYDIREYRRIHIVYLMGLLRLADYAQIHASRAPAIKLEIHSIRSPLSLREWRVHRSVTNITRTHDDPEALSISSRPERVTDFLRVKHWLTDLQREIDQTWAVLGEVYGRQTATRLDKLKLNIRRIRSNILDSFTSDEFVAEKISFKVAESEMLSLLLAPLYGDHPGYGIRELVQNARDAVAEAIALNAPHLDRVGGKVEVIVSLKEQATLRIADNGVGMNLDILKNYFLNAGASYRSSINWLRTHTDGDGNSNVVRSGRFGVGALAAFLIGDIVSVKTRHWNSQDLKGLSFSSTLHDKEIELKPTECSIGCEIEIQIKDSDISRIVDFVKSCTKYFSFSSDIPVEFHIETTTGARKYVCDREDSRNIADTFHTKNYPTVIWGTATSAEHALEYINGIAVTQISDNTNKNDGNIKVYERKHLFVTPNFSGDLSSIQGVAVSYSRARQLWIDVEDRNAFAPINLARTTFTSHDKDITQHINKFIFDRFVSFLDANPKGIRSSQQQSSRDSLVIFERKNIAFNNGFAFPTDNAVFVAYDIKTLFGIPYGLGDVSALEQSFDKLVLCAFAKASGSMSECIQRLRNKNVSISNGYASYVCLSEREYILKQAASNPNSPNWMKEAINNSIALQGDWRLVQIGRPNSSVLKKAIELGKALGNGPIEVIHNQTLPLGSRLGGVSRLAPGVFSPLWIEKFPAAELNVERF